jgi:hypothetical protein
MKKNLFISTCLLGLCTLFAGSCSEDKLSSQSVITLGKEGSTPLDQWLKRNYIDTYNIEFKYRYKDVESDFSYYTVPARYDRAVKMANLVKYSCLEAFDEAAGIDFTRNNFPKLIYLMGNWEFKNNGTYILGTAEGGKKILLSGINYIDQVLTDAKSINQYYLKTVYHEFTHILNQTKPYSADFQLVTGKGYVADSWSKEPYVTDNYCLEHGFISAYSQHSDIEDFAEMFSIYVTNTPEQWEKWMKIAEAKGQKGFIVSKLDIVRNYMRDSWGINLDQLRDIFLRRQADIVAGRIDLTDISL